MACVRNCHHSRLASRVRQNSPRTRLLASNQMMLHQRRYRLISSLKVENHPGLAKRLSVAPAQELGHPPPFAIGLMAGDGKPEGTQDQMVPCTTAKHQFTMAKMMNHLDAYPLVA